METLRPRSNSIWKRQLSSGDVGQAELGGMQALERELARETRLVEAFEGRPGARLALRVDALAAPAPAPVFVRPKCALGPIDAGLLRPAERAHRLRYVARFPRTHRPGDPCPDDQLQNGSATHASVIGKSTRSAIEGPKGGATGGSEDRSNEPLIAPARFPAICLIDR